MFLLECLYLTQEIWTEPSLCQAGCGFGRVFRSGGPICLISLGRTGDSLEPCRLSESLRVLDGARVQEIHVLEPRFWFFSKSFPQDLVIANRENFVG
jgi:hypothetical protein